MLYIDVLAVHVDETRDEVKRTLECSQTKERNGWKQVASIQVVVMGDQRHHPHDAIDALDAAYQEMRATLLAMVPK